MSQADKYKMAEKASTSAAKDVINSKTVLELLEEDDEFEVSQSSNLGSLKTTDHYAQKLSSFSTACIATDNVYI